MVVPSAGPAGSAGGTTDPGTRSASKVRGGSPATYRTRVANPGSATSVGSVSTVGLNSEVSVSSGSSGLIPSARTSRYRTVPTTPSEDAASRGPSDCCTSSSSCRNGSVASPVLP